LSSQASAASFTTVPVNSAITATLTIKAPIARAGELLAGEPEPAKGGLGGIGTARTCVGHLQPAAGGFGAAL
jgi:hypothetical protein